METKVLLRRINSSRGGITHLNKILSPHHQGKGFHTAMSKILNTATSSSTSEQTVSSVDIKVQVDTLKQSLQELKEQKKKAEETLREAKKKAKEDELKAIQDLKPKRFPTPFFVYTTLNYNIVREEMLQTNKIVQGQKDQLPIISKELKDRFGKLTPHDKKVIELYCEKEKEEYVKKMELYNKAKKDVRSDYPMTCYVRFYKEVASEIKAELAKTNQLVTACEMTKLASKKWKELDEASKLKYKEQTAKELAEYKARKAASVTTPTPTASAATTASQ